MTTATVGMIILPVVLLVVVFMIVLLVRRDRRRTDVTWHGADERDIAAARLKGQGRALPPTESHHFN